MICHHNIIHIPFKNHTRIRMEQMTWWSCFQSQTCIQSFCESCTCSVCVTEFNVMSILVAGCLLMLLTQVETSRPSDVHSPLGLVRPARWLILRGSHLCSCNNVAERGRTLHCDPRILLNLLCLKTSRELMFSAASACLWIVNCDENKPSQLVYYVMLIWHGANFW